MYGGAYLNSATVLTFERPKISSRMFVPEKVLQILVTCLSTNILRRTLELFFQGQRT